MAINTNALKFLDAEKVVALSADIFGGLNIFTSKFNGTSQKGATCTVLAAANELGRKNPTNHLSGTALAPHSVAVDYYDFVVPITPEEYNSGIGKDSVAEAVLIGLRNTLINAAIGAISQAGATSVDDLSGLNLSIDGGYKTLLANAEFLTGTVPQADQNAWRWQGDRLEMGAFGFDCIQKVPAIIAALTADAVAFSREKALAAWAVPVVPADVTSQTVDLGVNGMQVVLTEKSDPATEMVYIAARIIAGFKFLDAKAFNKSAV